MPADQSSRSMLLSKPRLTMLGNSTTSPVEMQQRKEVHLRPKKMVRVLYVGGAGDKRAYPPLPFPTTVFGPIGNINEVKNYLENGLAGLRLKDSYRGSYFGYYEIFGSDEIKKNVLPFLPTKDSPVIVIGHSLGGWNGAQLSFYLNELGYNVAMLITLDPVGRGFWVWAVSNIYPKTPSVATKFWLNVRARPSARDPSDAVADFGEQWDVKDLPMLTYDVDTNHANAIRMFITAPKNGTSAYARVIDCIKKAVE